MRRKRLLAVIESKWFANEITVRPLFDLLCDARHDRGEYLYERFVSKSSLEEVLRFVIQKRVSYIYLGSHCASSMIECPNGEKVPVSRIRDIILSESEKVGTRVAGLYFSGCYILTDKNARIIFGRPDHPKAPHWVCGYAGSAEWFPSSALDALFFSEFFDEDGRDREAIEAVARRLKWSQNALSKKYKFNIFVPEKGGGGGLVNLATA